MFGPLCKKTVYFMPELCTYHRGALTITIANTMATAPGMQDGEMQF